MVDAKSHYESLLAEHYSWMFGDFADKVAEQEALLRSLGVNAPGVAVDLGCGSGFQSIALAHLGATTVHAIDFSKTLLAELRGHADGLPIRTHHADILDFSKLVSVPADTIICMGDTLTHLTGLDDVLHLLGLAARALQPGGQIVLSWRDLSNPPHGPDRFIPLRQSEDRIMTCFLEDMGDTVRVHDIVHSRVQTDWTMSVSAYPKLKLSPAWIDGCLADAGFTITARDTVRGMTAMRATLERT